MQHTASMKVAAYSSSQQNKRARWSLLPLKRAPQFQAARFRRCVRAVALLLGPGELLQSANGAVPRAHSPYHVLHSVAIHKGFSVRSQTRAEATGGEEWCNTNPHRGSIQSRAFFKASRPVSYLNMRWTAILASVPGSLHHRIGTDAAGRILCNQLRVPSVQQFIALQGRPFTRHRQSVHAALPGPSWQHQRLDGPTITTAGYLAHPHLK